jgi:hypothetical protein
MIQLRRRGRVTAALLASAVTLVLAPAAFAASITGLPGLTTSTPVTTAPATTTPTPVAVPTTSTTSSGGLTPLEEVGIGVAALGLFGFIAYTIRSDARAHAPRQTTLGIDRERSTVTPRAERVRRSRARAKAARRARRSGR